MVMMISVRASSQGDEGDKVDIPRSRAYVYLQRSRAIPYEPPDDNWPDGDPKAVLWLGVRCSQFPRGQDGQGDLVKPSEMSTISGVRIEGRKQTSDVSYARTSKNS
jgi:hypothetical protein